MCVEVLGYESGFQRYRLSLSEFVEPLDPKAPGVHPKQNFRSQRGLYITEAVRQNVLPYLEARPKDSSVTQLLAWELTENRAFGVSVGKCDGSRDPVPWWVILPLLVWQQRGADRIILPTDRGAYFFLRLKKENDKTTHEALKLAFHAEALHGEWWLDFVSPDEKQGMCCIGQTFLSVR